MKSLLALLAAVLPALLLTACGGAHVAPGAHGGTGPAASLSSSQAGAASRPTTTGASRVALPQIEIKGDGDMDSDKYWGELDDESSPIGPLASAADRLAITGLVRRYYAAAVAGDGATACRLLYRVLAEAVPGDYGSAHAPPGLHDRECAEVMSKFFLQAVRGQLRIDSSTLKMVWVRVNLNNGAARFGFAGEKPNRYIMVHRERGAWKVDMLLDNGQRIREE